jgi:hypothetical protein
MWIWYVSASAGGDPAAIVATARAYGIGTLMVKAGDGTVPWSQFDSSLIATLHAAGLRVCAWQYVYGTYPAQEAQVGSAAVRRGADCLVIDAESQYEGRYVQAQSYLRALRGAIGGRFPVALAGFPYVDYHPGFPYSVFLGPRGAQYNVPQMYWRAIGTTVDGVYSHTYRYNRVYGRTIAPLGQVWEDPPPRQIVRFRLLAQAYGARGVSWWDWQEAFSRGWRAIAQRSGSLAGFTPTTAAPDLSQGSQGDLVVWAEERLISAGLQVPVNGRFNARTKAAVEAFQSAHGLTVDGMLGAATWSALLRYPPARVLWTRTGARITRGIRSAAQAAGYQLVAPVPASAGLPAKRDEIPARLGAG